MLYMKTIVLIIAMAVLLLAAVLRGMFAPPSKADAWTTAAFLLATCAFGALLVWSGR